MMRIKLFCTVAALTTAVLLTGCPPPGGAATPALTVFPTALGFDDDGVTEFFFISNTGGGTLTWSVAVDVAWLSVVDVSGSTTTETDKVRINADRTGLVPGDYNGTITVTSNAGTRNIPVSLEVQGTPLIQVSPSALNLLGSVDSGNITISNLGDGDLEWQIRAQDPETNALTAPPDYLTIDPVAGVTAPSGQSTVEVTVDRESVPEEISQIALFVVSNVGNAQVTVNLQATGGGDAQAEIGVEPAALDFGEEQTTLTFDVFNTGATGSNLNFMLATDRPNLVLLSTDSGTSVGTGDLFNLDRVTIEVTVDRTQIQGTTDGATITVSAPGLEDVDIPVSVSRANLTLEGAVNRTRPPYILRFTFLVRDALGAAIDTTDPAILEQLEAGFQIDEDGEPLDLDESNFFVTSADNLRTNLVLLLDYTGSMFNAGAGNGAVIAQMEEAARGFIQDLPAAYRVALMEYHDRQQSQRLIHNFSTQRDSLLTALDAFTVPFGENGASEVYDAVQEACMRLENEDVGTLPFNDADLRAVVFISDGRDTSSEAALSEVIDFATDRRCRLYPIGFGEDVNAAPLIQMATETGGRYYPAPTAADLQNLLENEFNMPADAPGLVTKELARQVVLTYFSLAEGEGTYLITLNYNGNTGFFERDAFVAPGDVRAGQIALHTTGIEAGEAEVFVRTDYVPRAVSQIRFRVNSPVPAAVTIAPGGLLDDGNWLLIHEGDSDPALDGVYTAITDDTNAVPFGSFGQLFRIVLSGIATPEVAMGFRIDNRIYVNPPFTKFFQYPDGILIETGVSSTAGVVPLGGDSDFDPDDPFAFDRDEDGVADFEDEFPDDEDFS